MVVNKEFERENKFIEWLFKEYENGLSTNKELFRVIENYRQQQGEVYCREFCVEDFGTLQELKEQRESFTEDNQDNQGKQDGTRSDREVKLSLKDSDGNALSPNQQEFFKNSKVVDKDGNVLVYAKGPFGEPKISKVVKIHLDNETAIELVRDTIYEYETNRRKQAYTASEIIEAYFGEELISEFVLGDFPSYKESKAEWERQFSRDDGFKNNEYNQREFDGERNLDEDSGTIKFSKKESFIVDKYFNSQIDKWNNLKQGSYVKVGEISKENPVCLVGMPDGVLRYDVDYD